VVNKEKAVITKPFEDREFRTALLKDLAEAKQNFFKMHEIFGLAYQSQVGGTITPVSTEESEPEAEPEAATSGTMVVTADVTNGTIVPANVTGLSFAVEANKIYGFRFLLKGNTTATTCALWLRFTGPASPTSFYAHVLMKIVGTDYAIVNELTAFEVNTDYASFGTTVEKGIRIEGFLVNGANAGTVQMRFRCEVAGQTVTVRAGSWGVWYKLN
jgi:hypothetical protein